MALTLNKHAVSWTAWWALWSRHCCGKVARGLAGGRVQSVAVKLLVEREREIKAFVPKEFWDINADTLTADNQDFRLLVAQRRFSFQARERNGILGGGCCAQ